MSQQQFCPMGGGHEYFPLTDPYYKNKSGDCTRLNTDVEYVMLCCSRCGETKETLAIDKRPG